jgi:hypothetical protein
MPPENVRPPSVKTGPAHSDAARDSQLRPSRPAGDRAEHAGVGSLSRGTQRVVASQAEVLAFLLDGVRVFVGCSISSADDEVERVFRWELWRVERGNAGSARVRRCREVLAAVRGRLVDLVDDPRMLVPLGSWFPA